MARILGRNETVRALPEMHFFEQLWDMRDAAPLPMPEATQLAARTLAVARDGYLARHDAGAYRDEAAELVRERSDRDGGDLRPFEVYAAVTGSEARRGGALYPCDHTPRNLLFASQILDWLPRARVVAMVRDPRDVVLSQRRKWRRRSLSGGDQSRRESARSLLAYHPVNASLVWRASVAAAAQIAGHPRAHLIRFESLVGEPERVTREVSEFLEIEWVPEMLDVKAAGSSRLADSERLGIDRSRAQSWRSADSRERADVAICQAVCRSEMGRQGYRPEPVRPSIAAFLWQVASWPARAVLGVAMNLRRVRSPGAAITTRLRWLRRPGATA